MKNEPENNFAEAPSSQRSNTGFQQGFGGETPPDNPVSEAAQDEQKPAFSIDFWTLLEVVLAHRRQVLMSGILFCVLGAFLGTKLIRTTYVTSAQMSRYEAPLASDAYKPQTLGTAAIVDLIGTPEVFERVGGSLNSPADGEYVAKRLKVTPERNSDIITVQAAGNDLQEVLALANGFSRQAILLSKASQKKEAEDAARFIAQQLKESDQDRSRVKAQLAEIEAARIASRLKEQTDSPVIIDTTGKAKASASLSSRLEERVIAARDELSNLQARYTDAHPLVREQAAKLATLEAQLGESVKSSIAEGRNPNASAPSRNASTAMLPDQSNGYDALVARLATLEANDVKLVARQRAIEIFTNSAPGYLRVLHAATERDTTVQHYRASIVILSLFLGFMGLLGAISVVAARELLDDRLKTGTDLKRVTQLPLLATLGELDQMSPAARETWAFRTWTALQRHMTVSPNHGLVCGFTSSGPAEGRSTWIDLLSSAAKQCGFRVLTISSRMTGSDSAKENTPASQAPAAAGPGGSASPWDSNDFSALVAGPSVQSLEQISGNSTSASVRYPLPLGWVWNLERRKQWQQALNSWRTIEHIVILVELPPLSDPESALLAMNVPNLIWLAESHKANAKDTLVHLETLRNARCNLVGTVLNRERRSVLKNRFSRWLKPKAMLGSSVAMMCSSLSGQVPTPSPLPDQPAAQTASSFSVVNPAQRAPWQQKLTLGPGDLLNISLFGQPELTQTQVPIGPDGRISFLEAENVLAAGLSVDEFRAALNTELAKSRRAPDVIVVPAAYRSKKIYVLGYVVRKGVYTLDRPMTIIEAVAQAKGLESGGADPSQSVAADLGRSFLSRQGKHMPVDFEKLFNEGDLSQNIALEPGDYLYFPPNARKEIYVLGEVRFPGPMDYNAKSTTLAAIAVRGGFTDKAWQKKLLVVRGSLEKPKTFIVDAQSVLTAQSSDFRLQPNDIVYVSSRPWIRAEDLLDSLASAYVQSVAVTISGLHIDPIGRSR